MTVSSTAVRAAAGLRAEPYRWALALLLLGYALLWCALDATPFQDVPNHVSRAVVIGDLLFDGGARFGDVFEFHWVAIPYLLGDLLLLPLVRAFPPDVAARAWVALEWASLPLAVAVLLRTWRCSGWAVAVGALLATYLATDTFFLMGFANFRLGVALVLLGLAAWERAQHAPLYWLAYAAAVVAAWLMHLSALVFLAGTTALLAALRAAEGRLAWRRALAIALPALALLAWHLAFREPPNLAPSLQPSAAVKALRVASPLVRFSDPADYALCAGFVLLVFVPLLAGLRGRLSDLQVELCVLAVAFLGLYFVLPLQKGAIWAIDNRALALAWVYAALAALVTVDRLPGRLRAGWAAGACLLSAANLALLAAVLVPDNASMRDYRALAASVPRGATLLGVVTQPMQGATNPLAHAASYATILADAVVPYTFSGNEQMPMRYFRFRHRPDAPWQFWYQQSLRPAHLASTVARYDYLLVGLPVDWRRLPPGLEIVDANASAALVRPAPPAVGARVAQRHDAG